MCSSTSLGEDCVCAIGADDMADGRSSKLALSLESEVVSWCSPGSDFVWVSVFAFVEVLVSSDEVVTVDSVCSCTEGCLVDVASVVCAAWVSDC